MVKQTSAAGSGSARLASFLPRCRSQRSQSRQGSQRGWGWFPDSPPRPEGPEPRGGLCRGVAGPPGCEASCQELWPHPVCSRRDRSWGVSPTGPRCEGSSSPRPPRPPRPRPRVPLGPGTGSSQAGLGRPKGVSGEAERRTLWGRRKGEGAGVSKRGAQPRSAVCHLCGVRPDRPIPLSRRLPHLPQGEDTAGVSQAGCEGQRQ